MPDKPSESVLTDEEWLTLARERGAEWYLPDFARAVERLVRERLAGILSQRADALAQASHGDNSYGHAAETMDEAANIVRGKP